MKVRAVLAAWVVVAAILGAAAAAIILAAGPAPPLFHGAPVVVIGSSLIHNAVPKQRDELEPGDTQRLAGLLGDGRSHWRVGPNAITEDDTTALLSHAIDEHAQTVLVEANVLLFDFGRNRVSGRCDQPAGGLRREAKVLQRDFTDIYARWSGRPGELDEDPVTDEFARVGAPLSELRRGIYPLVLRGPCRFDALARLAARARAQGTAIVLLIPPRSQSADRLLGAVQKRMLADRAAALAKMLGAAVYVPDGVWPDAEFVDGEHLNRRGRIHFVAALRYWWKARR